MLIRKFDIITGLSIDVEEDVIFEPVQVMVPPEISDRQFFQQLYVGGFGTPPVSQEEALAAVMVGTLPQAVESIVLSLPAERQFDARMLLSGATSFLRSHPLVATFGAALGMSEAELDAFWISAYDL